MLLLYAGPLLGEVVKNMKDKRDGKMSLKQKAFMYSAVCNWTLLKLLLNNSVQIINKTGSFVISTKNKYLYLSIAVCLRVAWFNNNRIYVCHGHIQPHATTICIQCSRGVVQH